MAEDEQDDGRKNVPRNMPGGIFSSMGKTKPIGVLGVLPQIGMSNFWWGIGRTMVSQDHGLNGVLKVLQEPSPWTKQLFKKIELGAQLLKTNLPIFGEHLEQFRKGWELLPERTRNALVTMAEAGWYLDLEMGISEVLGFSKCMEEEGEAAAEAGMVEHFESRLDAIHASLVKGFPDRRPFFDAAFAAIARDEHILAIPVLLMQTDGICKDVGDSYFFIRAKGKGPEQPAVSKYVLQTARSRLGEAFLCVFEAVRPIGFSEGQRGADFQGLNRHTVLHGESLDYGTRVNSLKAVSLLNYVGQILLRKLQADEEPNSGDAGDGSSVCAGE